VSLGGVSGDSEHREITAFKGAIQMKITRVAVVFAVLSMLGSLNLTYGAPYFIVQKTSGTLAIVGSASSSGALVGGPYDSAAEARTALASLKNNLSLRERISGEDRFASNSRKSESVYQAVSQSEGPASLATLGRASGLPDVPLSRLPLGDLTAQFSPEELAAPTPQAPAFVMYPDFNFLLSNPVSSAASAGSIPVPLSTIGQMPTLPVTVPSVPLTSVPSGLPFSASPLPFVLGR
jgi:hypothetical protein